MVTSGEIFYGCFWRIAKDKRDEATSTLRTALKAKGDAEFYDLLDDLSEKHKAHVSFKDGEATIYFGVPITSLTEADNDFDEMALLRVMDLNHGNLRQDVREEMTKIMDGVPFDLREHVSAPKFGVAWAAG